MVRDKEKFDQAVNLRKRGFTLEEIARYCDISKSTASKWLQNNDFSMQVTAQNKRRAGQENAKRLRLISKARSVERAVRYKEVMRSAETEFKHYQDDPLFVAGIMLYLGEGDIKHERLIRMASARPDAHAIFIKFALEYLGVEKSKIRFWILLYPDLSEEVCMKKWHKVIGIPYSQFYKNQVIPTKSQKQTLHFGVGNTIIGNTVLKQKLNRWVELTAVKLRKHR